jgi:hypothetical protein
MDSSNSNYLPMAVPLAPPADDTVNGTWIWIENDGNCEDINKNDNREILHTEKINKDIVDIDNTSNNKKDKNISWIKRKFNKIIPGQSNKIDKIFNVADKSYKFVEKKPGLAIIAVGLGVGTMYIATKLILNGGFIYFCMKPNVTFNTTNNANKTK